MCLPQLTSNSICYRLVVYSTDMCMYKIGMDLFGFICVLCVFSFGLLTFRAKLFKLKKQTESPTFLEANNSIYGI